MKYVLMLVLGAAIGFLTATMVGNSLRQVHAFPRGVMAVMQHHVGNLRQSVRDDRCEAADVQRRLDGLFQLTADVPAAFPGLRDSQAFLDYNATLRTRLSAARDAEPTSCSTLVPLLQEVTDACSACHRDYR